MAGPAYGPDQGKFLKVVPVDYLGNETGLVGNPLRVDPTGTTVQPVIVVGGVTLTPVAISFSSSGANTVVAAVAAQVVSVYRLMLTFAGATNITLQDTAATPFTGAMTFFAGGNLTVDSDSYPYFVTTAGNGFAINSSNAVQVSGTIWYTQA